MCIYIYIIHIHPWNHSVGNFITPSDEVHDFSGRLVNHQTGFYLVGYGKRRLSSPESGPY